jgi:hypothetical protein
MWAEMWAGNVWVKIDQYGWDKTAVSTLPDRADLEFSADRTGF